MEWLEAKNIIMKWFDCTIIENLWVIFLRQIYATNPQNIIKNFNSSKLGKNRQRNNLEADRA